MNLAAATQRCILMSAPAKMRAKNLRALLAGLALDVQGDIPDRQITDITLDSRQVRSGGAFIALPGARTHGIGFAQQAIGAGARAILWQPSAAVAAPRVPDEVALVAVPGLSSILGELADRFFDAPSQAVRVVGVTGTNGKTTTAHVLAEALSRLGESSAYAGTLGVGRIEALQPAAHTTPDCITVQRQLAELRDQHVRYASMEVSSHALDQHRVDGVRFDTAVFTNLTRDHLDYHGSLDAYGAAKARLFQRPELRQAVLNAEDAFGRELATRAAAPALVLYSRHGEPMPAPGARSGVRQVFARHVAAGPGGIEVEIDGSWGASRLRSRFVGDFNVENLLAALATLLGWDVPLAGAVAALEGCTAPPGRMEALSLPGKPLVVIDYAHTPDALLKALQAARAHCHGKLVCVFGCGGERDRGKRPLMAQVAERLADEVIVTDDNPRGEDGDAIVADILAGLSRPQRAVIERDRAQAIMAAIAGARAGDAVLIAGKGHEDYQIVGIERRHFSDRETAQAALGAGA